MPDLKKKYNFDYFKKLYDTSSLKDFKYVYIYSDFRFILGQNLDEINDFLKKFILLFLKNNQTLIVPTFSYSKDKFEITKTKSKVGFFSNYLLSLKESVRSEHPIFSYTALGINKKIVENIGKSAFGDNSMHQRLLFENCCFLHLGRDLSDGNTMVHHVEQNLNASYRFDKVFKSKVYLKNKYLGKNYSAYVRKNNKKKTFFSFKKIIKKIKKEKFINYLNNNKGLKSFFYYSYDEMYFFLHRQYLEDRNIFLQN